MKITRLIYQVSVLLVTTVTISTGIAGSVDTFGALPIPLSTPTTQTITQINSVVIDGDIQVNLKQLTAKQQDYYQVDGGGSLWMQAYYVGATLYLKSLPPPPGVRPPKTRVPLIVQPTIVTVGLKQLNSVVVNGGSSIIASQLRTPSLHILSATSGQINLRGVIGLQDLTTVGPSNIFIGGINSPQLSVHNSGNANIQLIGVAQNLQIRASKQGRVDAHYLHTAVAYVQTSDQAHAQVQASESLSAFTSQQSIIMYYGQPQHMTELSKDSGNVLPGS